MPLTAGTASDLIVEWVGEQYEASRAFGAWLSALNDPDVAMESEWTDGGLEFRWHRKDCQCSN